MFRILSRQRDLTTTILVVVAKVDAKGTGKIQQPMQSCSTMEIARCFCDYLVQIAENVSYPLPPLGCTQFSLRVGFSNYICRPANRHRIRSVQIQNAATAATGARTRRRLGVIINQAVTFVLPLHQRKLCGFACWGRH